MVVDYRIHVFITVEKVYATSKYLYHQRRAEGGKGGQSHPPKWFWRGDCPPKKISKTKKFLFKTSLYGLKYYKIVKKWSENASREVQNQKFSYRGEGDAPSPGPRPWPWASARIIGPSGRDSSFFPPQKIPLHALVKSTPGSKTEILL